VLQKVLRPVRWIRRAWRALWAGSDLGGGDNESLGSFGAAHAGYPHSGDVDEGSRGQGRISS
jgi:hypothetical protein